MKATHEFKLDDKSYDGEGIITITEENPFSQRPKTFTITIIIPYEKFDEHATFTISEENIAFIVNRLLSILE